MSTTNKPEAKAARRLRKYLKNLSFQTNKVKYRVVNGHVMPYQETGRDYVADYETGLIEVFEKSHNVFDMIDHTVQTNETDEIPGQIPTVKKTQIDVLDTSKPKEKAII
jgi:hypothetical protein